LVEEGMRVKEVTTEIKYCLRGWKKDQP
jgi:hypothetical protein